MLSLLLNGEIALFALILIALTISLSFHEFGHALVAKWCGDDTAQRAGRLTVNPIAHLDPMGLLMVVFVGFGYAKPVPTDPRNFRYRWAAPAIAFAGPAMNLLLAILAVNIYLYAQTQGIEALTDTGQSYFFKYLTIINLLLMLFNLLPIGALDGHYILPYFLSRNAAYRYEQFNDQYGNFILMGLILLSVMGVPIFSYLVSFAERLIPYIAWL